MVREAPPACPKCGWKRDAEAGACARCGLAVRRWTLFSPPPEDATLAQAWQECERRWEEPAPHLAALDVASRLGELPALARRYREVLSARPADPVATARLGKIATLVELSLRSQAKTLASTGTARALWAFVYGGSTLMLVAVVWILFKVLTRH